MVSTVPMKETIIAINSAETLKQQSRGTAPVIVVREVFFRVRKLPNGQPDSPKGDRDDTTATPHPRGSLEPSVEKPHEGHPAPSGTSRNSECGPELEGAVEAVHDLVRSAHRPHTGTFSPKKADGGAT